MDEIKKILAEGSPAQVKALFLFNESTDPDLIRKKYRLWARYFFPKFFKSPDAPFHERMDSKRIRIYLGLDSEFLNIAFRDSAKTTGAKMFRAYAIANDSSHFRKYMRILSKDLGNAKQSVTDIYNMLNSSRVNALYPEIFEKTTSKREETMASFTTATGVKVIADTVGVDQRGALQEESRPDFDWYDDFETRLSLTSAITTHKIWTTMEEARTGLAKGGSSEYTCNYLSERGNVHKLVLKIENKIIIPIEEYGIPTWDRFTKEDIAKIKKSAEDFTGEYLCKPSASKDVYFDRECVDRQKPKEMLSELAGMKIWTKYKPDNRISSGHDVGGGVRLDHSTSVFIDLDCIPAQVMATYKDNETKPDAFAHVIKKQANKFGDNYIAVEKNFGSTLDILKTIYPPSKIHKTHSPNPKIITQAPREYGWETNGLTKPIMLADLSKAIEDGLLELNDPDLIAEARSYTTGDLMDNEIDPRLMTRHFDLLMACAIAWVVRIYVKKPDKSNGIPAVREKKLNQAR